MKVLYAIQATGNGHISRAKELIPYLVKFCKVDVLLSGYSSEIQLSYPVKYRFRGISFVFGKNGGIDILKTLKSINVWLFFKNVRQLDLNEYDMIINDFEPVSAWASYFQKKYCVALSHQFSLLNNKVPKPAKKPFLSHFILKYFAPSNIGYGFHFQRYSKEIYLPVIKKEIRLKKPIKKNHFVVYLPAFDEKKIIEILSKIKSTKWIVFSKHTNTKLNYGNVRVEPISSLSFNSLLSSCRGVLCGAGFETPAEALYLKKKLMVIPMKNQYEQICNAEALKQMGVPVLYNLTNSSETYIEEWVKSRTYIRVNYSSPHEVLNKLFIDFIKYNSSPYYVLK